VVELSIPVADGRVVTANRKMEIIIVGILQEQALDIDAESVLLTRIYTVNVFGPTFKNDLAQKFKLFRNVGGDKQIELP
jgi:hypothetical protein